MSARADPAATLVSGDIYSGRGAELYDRIIADDRSEIRETMRAVRGRESVLELAAGSGRVTLPLLRMVRSVTAIDRSAELLRLLAERARNDRSRLTLREADLLTHDWGAGYDAVVIATTSIALFDAAQREVIFERAAQSTGAEATMIVSVLDCTVGAAEDHWSARILPNVELTEQCDRTRDRRITTITEYGPDDGVLGRYRGAVWTISADQVSTQLGRAGFSVQESQRLATSGLGDHMLLIGRKP